jgi:hypothetical protein
MVRSKYSRRIVPISLSTKGWDIRDRLDFSDLQDAQIGLPLPKLEQRVVIGAESFGHSELATKGSVKHPAQSHSIDRAGLNPKSNDAAAELIHNNQHPMGTQGGRFAPEQIQTPEAVLPVAQDS